MGIVWRSMVVSCALLAEADEADAWSSVRNDEGLIIDKNDFGFDIVLLQFGDLLKLCIEITKDTSYKVGVECVDQEVQVVLSVLALGI